MNSLVFLTILARAIAFNLPTDSDVDMKLNTFGRSNKLTNQKQKSLQFITWRLFTAQHVSGVLTPILRRSTTAVAASGFTVGAQW